MRSGEWSRSKGSSEAIGRWQRAQDRLVGGDEAGVLSTQGSVCDPVATSLTRLRSPPRPHFRRRPMLTAIRRPRAPSLSAATPANPLVHHTRLRGRKTTALGWPACVSRKQGHVNLRRLHRSGRDSVGHGAAAPGVLGRPAGLGLGVAREPLTANVPSGSVPWTTICLRPRRRSPSDAAVKRSQAAGEADKQTEHHQGEQDEDGWARVRGRLRRRAMPARRRAAGAAGPVSARCPRSATRPSRAGSTPGRPRPRPQSW